MDSSITTNLGAIGSITGGVGAFITAIIAFFAALFAWQQYNVARKFNAEDAYLAFQWRSFENPEFAAPDYNIILNDRHKSISYHWFVLSMLVAMERVITVLPKDQSWKRSIEDDLEAHREYLSNPNFLKYIRGFYPETQLFLEDFIENKIGRNANAQS